MLISELSKRTGITIHTIRYYENLGLIEGTSDESVKTNNYKQYDNVAAERLEIIVEAKEVGFTLNEIRKLLDNWYSTTSPRSVQIEMFTDKITEIDKKIKQLKQVKSRLEKVVNEIQTKGMDC